MIGINRLDRQHHALVVAEIGQAHDGSLGILHSYIDALSKSGVDAVKFQVHIANAESSPNEPFRVNFSIQDQSRFDYWKRIEFTAQDWAHIKSHCESVGLEFIATPFSVAATHLLRDIECTTFKIGSADVNNRLLLHQVRQYAKEVIFSTGLASDLEVRHALAFFEEADIPTAVLKCTTMYPTPPSYLDLKGLTELIAQLPCPVGLSDHTGSIYSGIAAMALGARIIEAHVVFDKRMFGPDSSSSLTIDDFGRLVEARDFIAEAMQQSDTRALNPEWNHLREVFGRSISLRHDLKKGDPLGIADLECTKPAGLGIPAEDFERVVGRSLIKDIFRGDFLHWEDLENDQS